MLKTNQKQFKLRVEFKDFDLPEYLEGDNWAKVCKMAVFGCQNAPFPVKRIMIMFPDGSETELPLYNLKNRRRAGRWIKQR